MDSVNALFKTIEILGPTSSLISCIILGLVIRHIYKMSNQLEAGRNAVSAKIKIDMFVTGSHIVITLAVTIT